MTEELVNKTRSIAIVSGKGGSGKTLIATSMAQGLAIEGLSVLLIDADFGTGGLTYYLGFSTFKKTQYGLSEYSSNSPDPHKEVSSFISTPNDEAIKRSPYIRMISFISVGKHRLVDGKQIEFKTNPIETLISDLHSKFDVMIFDCRGGVDSQSISICRAVDEIVMIVETDAASIQASQHLSNILSEKQLDHKLTGFILNKVMDDPSSLANTGRTFFNTDYLGAVPFDISTTREFIKGNMPSSISLFSKHVFHATSKIVPNLNNLANTKILLPEEFSTITLKNPKIRLGNFILAIMGIYLWIAFITAKYLDSSMPLNNEGAAFLVISLLFFLAALSDKVKILLGETARRYSSIFRKAFFRSSK